MGPDRRPGNRQGSRGPRQPGLRTGLSAPARQVLAHLGRALAAVGAAQGHVAKITIYAAGHWHECLPAIDAARAGLFADHKPAVVGVETLARPEYLIDVHAIAVIDR
jgi:enamine deaminase RidA (YjgF/YER057c/UK114 family)